MKVVLRKAGTVDAAEQDVAIHYDRKRKEAEE
jgi:hypothetical protein